MIDGDLDKMERFIETIDDLKLERKVAGGSCSDIYEMKSGLYFKKFCNDYCDLNDSINIEFLETIRTISDIESLPFIVRAIDIYRNKNSLFGYSMDRVNACVLENVSDNVLIFDMLSGFENLKSGIRNLSDSFVKTEDIGGDNILFNGNMYLLDLDLSLVDKRYIPDELYQETRNSVFKSIFYKMTGLLHTEEVLNDDYVGYMTNFVDFCSNYSDSDIKSISQLKTVCKKVYKKTIN